MRTSTNRSEDLNDPSTELPCSSILMELERGVMVAGLLKVGRKTKRKAEQSYHPQEPGDDQIFSNGSPFCAEQFYIVDCVSLL